MKQERPHFSIIIPTFNRAQLLHETIKSILDQGNADFEVIVVDDGSADNTAEVVAEFYDERIHYIKIRNSERGAARNAGLKIARGEYINYFDSDDLLNPCLRALHDFIIEQNSPPVVFGQIEHIFENGRVVRVTKKSSDFKRSILHNNFLACGAVFLRRDVASSFLFSEDRRLSGTEDWELWLRIYATHEFAECPLVVFRQREHAFRSLNQARANAVKERECTFIELIGKEEHALLKRFTKAEINLLRADRLTLVALAQCEAGNRKEALVHWVASLQTSIAVVRRKRFMAVGKKIFLFL